MNSREMRRVGSPEGSGWGNGLWLHLDTAQVLFCTSLEVAR